MTQLAQVPPSSEKCETQGLDSGQSDPPLPSQWLPKTNLPAECLFSGYNSGEEDSAQTDC